MSAAKQVLPPFPYFGGKSSMASKIVDLFPAHDHYVEPFCGSLSVLLAKEPSAHETVNDLDGALMTFWRVLRDRTDDLARVCALTPHSRAEQALSYEHPDETDEIEIARRVWVQLTQGRNATRRASGTGWRFQISTAIGKSIPSYLATYADRIMAAAERLHGVSLESQPALDVITRYGTDPGVLLYCDPPYVADTRTWGSNYLVEMREDDEHRALASALHDCASAVVLSGYASPLYDDLYADWDMTSFNAHTGQGTVGKRTEVLWSNRPIAAEHLFSDVTA